MWEQSGLEELMAAATNKNNIAGTIFEVITTQVSQHNGVEKWLSTIAPGSDDQALMEYYTYLAKT
eukprot:9991003-Karenia_brevis.AAC.1